MLSSPPISIPVVILSDIAVVRKVFQECATHLKSIHAFLGFVQYLSVGSDQGGKGDTAAPNPSIRRLLSIGHVTAAKEKVPIDCMLLLEKLEHNLLLIWSVDAYVDDTHGPLTYAPSSATLVTRPSTVP